jgi:glycosyltransferase involved in cell wall biosynthesis
LVTAISRGVHETYRSLGVPEERIRDIPNGVDVARIAHHDVDRGMVRRELGVRPDADVVLTVCRNEPLAKGLDLIPAIAATVAARHPRARWLVVGAVGGRLSFEIEQRGLADIVTLVPEQRSRVARESLPGDSMLDLYRASDVFCLPSRIEGLPLVVLEAMAAGMPVVSTDVPGCRDLVDPGNTGLLATSDDADALAACVIQLLTDSAARSRMGARARERAWRFAWSEVAPEYERAYADVIAAHRLRHSERRS